MAQEISCPKLVLVEGKDDELFFAALCQHLGLGDIQFRQISGKANFRNALRAVVSDPGFSKVIALGIFLDAEDNPKATFQSVCDALQKVGLPVPTQPMTPASGYPRVSVMILPNAQNPGSLEDVCLKAVAGTPVMKCVDKFFCCLQRQGLPLPKSLPKAKVLAYLTSKPEPDKRLGESAQAGYWDWNHPAFDALKNFLLSL